MDVFECVRSKKKKKKMFDLITLYFRKAIRTVIPLCKEFIQY